MRYGIAVLVAVFLLIIGSVVIISRSIGSGPAQVESARVTKVAEYSASDDARVSWTVQGPLVGDDEYQAVRITISQDKRVAEFLRGYALRVENRVEQDNSPEGFVAFTRALDEAGFGQERNVEQADERGVCPTGNRYVYRLTEGSNEVMRTWSDDCDDDNGPFAGPDAFEVHELFRMQITDYYEFVYANNAVIQ